MNFIKRHWKLLIVCVVFLSVSLICIIDFFTGRIDGKLIDYSKGSGISSLYSYDMSAETKKDITEKPEHYREYFITVYIKNITNHTIRNVDVDLSGRYQNVWFSRIGLAEWAIDLGPGEEYSERVRFIIDTKNMTEDQIDKQIRGFGIMVSSTDFARFPLKIIRNIKTIYFEGVS